MSRESDYIDRLEMWATLAAQELQEFCDDAQEARGEPEGTSALPGTRMLISDLDNILKYSP